MASVDRSNLQFPWSLHSVKACKILSVLKSELFMKVLPSKRNSAAWSDATRSAHTQSDYLQLMIQMKQFSINHLISWNNNEKIMFFLLFQPSLLMISPLPSVQQASALRATLTYSLTARNSLDHNGCLVIHQLNYIVTNSAQMGISWST